MNLLFPELGVSLGWKGNFDTIKTEGGSDSLTVDCFLFADILCLVSGEASVLSTAIEVIHAVGSELGSSNFEGELIPERESVKQLRRKRSLDNAAQRRAYSAPPAVEGSPKNSKETGIDSLPAGDSSIHIRAAVASVRRRGNEDDPSLRRVLAQQPEARCLCGC